MAVATAQRPRAALHTLGCRLNQSETNLLAEKLTAAGYALVPFGAPAELAIVNTCTVTREADAKSRKLVRQFIRQNPHAYTAVIGCYAQIGAEALADIEGIDLIVGNQEKLNVLDYVAAGKNATPLIVRDRFLRDDFTIDFAGEGTPLTTRANLKVQDGCDFMCSFCVIPRARGRARSRALPNLLDEARSLVQRGARELVLTGVNIGTYAWEGHNILQVVEALAQVEGLARIRISSIEPTTIPTALFDWMADPAHPLVPHLHIPLQSGSDRTLSAMRRRDDRAAFIAFIEEAAARVPDLCIGTDVLVGFPGETKADFNDTERLLREAPVHYAHVFKYSARPGTASTRLADPVAPGVMAARSARLRKLSAEKTQAFRARFIGREVVVLIERAQNGHWCGHTANYIPVAMPGSANLRNTLQTVRLTRVGPEYAYST